MTLADMLPALALVATLSSAAACYAGSRHCAWPAWRHHARAARRAAALLAAVALVAWSDALGVGAGLCTMLGAWMAMAIALPFVATWSRARAGTRTAGASR